MARFRIPSGYDDVSGPYVGKFDHTGHSEIVVFRLLWNYKKTRIIIIINMNSVNLKCDQKQKNFKWEASDNDKNPKPTYPGIMILMKSSFLS